MMNYMINKSELEIAELLVAER